MTKLYNDAMLDRDRPAFEIEITKKMIGAGVAAAHRFHFGEPMDRIVEDIYLMMEIERLNQ